MNRARYEGLGREHKAVVDELSREPVSIKAAEGFDGVDRKSLEVDPDKCNQLVRAHPETGVAR